MTCAQELIEVCHRVHAQGLVSGLGGDISTRMNDGFLITPAGHSLVVCVGSTMEEALNLVGKIETNAARRTKKQWSRSLLHFLIKSEILKERKK